MSKQAQPPRHEPRIASPWLSVFLLGLGIASGLKDGRPFDMGEMLGGACLLAGSLALALANGLALWLLAQGASLRLRRVLAVLLKAIAYYPFAVFAWLATALVIGSLHVPVEGFLPALPESCAACALWYWLLPAMVLAAPLGAEFAAEPLWMKPASAGPRLPREDEAGKTQILSFFLLGIGQRIQWYSALGAMFLAVAGGVFRLDAIPPCPSRFGMSPLAPWLVVAGIVGLAWWSALLVLTPLFSGQILAERVRRRKILESSIAIGLPPAGAWRRHVLPPLLREGITAGFEFCAWLWVIEISYIYVLANKHLLDAMLARTIDGDMTIPGLALVPAAFALCLWLLSRMFLPSKLPKSHGHK